MTPNPTADVDDEAVNRRLARVFASSARDDEADAAFGITVTVRGDNGVAMAAQRARMHATAVAEARPHLALGDDDRF